MGGGKASIISKKGVASSHALRPCVPASARLLARPKVSMDCLLDVCSVVDSVDSDHRMRAPREYVPNAPECRDAQFALKHTLTPRSRVGLRTHGAHLSIFADVVRLSWMTYHHRGIAVYRDNLPGGRAYMFLSHPADE